ncbi:MAG: TetR/AcrR family transcriptional regulator [Candidatus Sericytochromatia bacterium]|nr:TetR/AcrR family transcriptional regulator [Candidatus Sericytochromatia bacterium]
MNRPRQFDAQEARAVLTAMFTAHGYGGTSLAMLTNAIGLGKQSLYNAFGDKQALYLQALDATAARQAFARAQAAQAPDGRAALAGLLSDFVARCQHPDPAVNNCIFSAGLLEGIEEPAIAERLRQGWQGMKELFQELITRGQADGSIRQNVDPETAARLMMVVISGLRVTGRAIPDKRDLDAVVHLALGVLDPP